VVDGGLLSNFPIGLFFSSDENIDEIMGEGMQSEKVIGLLIDENQEVPGSGDPPAMGLSAPGMLDRIDLLEASYTSRAAPRLCQCRFPSPRVRLPPPRARPADRRPAADLYRRRLPFLP
jgi:hypothetical protein